MSCEGKRWRSRNEKRQEKKAAEEREIRRRAMSMDKKVSRAIKYRKGFGKPFFLKEISDV